MIPAGRGDSIIACAHAITGQCCHLLFWLRIIVPSKYCWRAYISWSAFYFRRMLIIAGRLNTSGPIILAGRLFFPLVRSIIPTRLMVTISCRSPISAAGPLVISGAGM